MKPTPLHSYILVRSDIPLAAQMAQCAHAAQEAAFLLGADPGVPIHVVILSCPDEPALLAAAERLAKKGIETGVFYEPDWPKGHTALYAKPQERTSALRSAMGAYPLWSAPAAPEAAFEIEPTDEPLHSTIVITKDGERLAKLCHLLSKTGLELSNRLYYLRKTLAKAGVESDRDLDALEEWADLIDYGGGPEEWIKACDDPRSGYKEFLGYLAEPHEGDCTAIACSCCRCWAERTLGIDTSPPSKAVGSRLLGERYARLKAAAAAQADPSALPA